MTLTNRYRLLLGLIPLLLLLLAASPTPPALNVPIAPRVIADLNQHGSARIWLQLHAQADLTSLARLPNLSDRPAHLTASLQQVAALSQADLKATLTDRQVPFRAYWLVNGIALTADVALLAELARHPAVAEIYSDAWFPGQLATADYGPHPATASNQWGVDKVNAPTIWQQGFTGQGIVVGGADTGIYWQHAILQPNYRGWNGTTADHNFHWWDAVHVAGSTCGADSPFPCDDNNHGTHTLGTAVGLNGYGVAPGASWIGCRNMNNGFGTPSTYIECLQFFLAPTDLNGQNPNPALHADVVVNSYYCPPAEGCNLNSLTAAVDAMRAAGIFMSVSAGNNGSSTCSTIRFTPAHLESSISIGATNSNDTIASFSSTGPVTADGSDRPKPDLVAPGVSVSSGNRFGGYNSYSGTSMASPHVAGVVALLWSAFPYLKNDVDATETLLKQTAVPLISTLTCDGGITNNSVPNFVFGFGRVDVAAAYGIASKPYKTYLPFFPNN